jgi:hypothetical protein
MEDKNIDQLTRNLMQGAIEKPSASLMGRIMLRVMKENPSIRKVKVKKNFVFQWMLGGMIAYVVLGVIALIFWLSNPESTTQIENTLKDVFPLVTFFVGIILMFLFFAQLDKWLGQKMSKRT